MNVPSNLQILLTEEGTQIVDWRVTGFGPLSFILLKIIIIVIISSDSNYTVQYQTDTMCVCLIVKY